MQSMAEVWLHDATLVLDLPHWHSDGNLPATGQHNWECLRLWLLLSDLLQCDMNFIILEVSHSDLCARMQQLVSTIILRSFLLAVFENPFSGAKQPHLPWA